MSELTCFKAYDIRGKLNVDLDERVAYRIGRAFAEHLLAKKVVVGGDVRLSSEPLKLALAAGLIDGGASVLDLGMTGTEEIYFASNYLDVDGGIEVTASHNPIDYNGMKLVKGGALPISGDTGLFDIQTLASSYSQDSIDHGLCHYAHPSVKIGNTFDSKKASELFEKGISSIDVDKLKKSDCYQQHDTVNEYIAHVLSYVELTHFTPLKLVVNAGNGAAGPTIDAMEKACKVRGFPIEFIKVNHTPDGTFPNGIPNPLLPENRGATSKAVVEHGADMGIAWDGDFDRCFLFDEKGEFVEGYYIVGLLAKAFLQKQAGEKIIYDPRVYWNTEEIVNHENGIPVKSKTGHAFIKERMRAENAIYGGEMSAHHYFRDFAYCDSGMIPWLLVAELICKDKKPLSDMVKDRIAMFPSSGEINATVKDADMVLARVQSHFEAEALSIESIDGVGMEFDGWRFNLRKSNTEPVIRLNVEARGDAALMKEKTTLLLGLLQA
ncbi:phosphomannomutase CpsG [Aestuariibacter sp. AA17]|uniref:phosphomannomutase n=1 Tax=Fluctibacter corallii TaxID=2984329 RepID=A0ABT3A9L3_9ALTE|nr:phosphomannomutase CpsG [Aestuariibacter sp. AA17]MCV2885290.1 phosphomannomutase CpsG [Aestuariibacter sp. AA17]